MLLGLKGMGLCCHLKVMCSPFLGIEVKGFVWGFCGYAVSIFVICPCEVSFCSGELSKGQSLLVSSHLFNVVLKESLLLFLEVVTLLHCSAGSFQSVHVVRSRGGFHIGWELCKGAWGH